MKETIRDIMTRDVEKAAPETSLRDAAQLMRSRDIGSLPVCEGRRVIGVVTDRDIAVRGVAEGRDPGSTPVREVMSTAVVSVREDADLADAERLMHDRQLRRLPVVDDHGELVGYLAMARLARSENAKTAGKVLRGVSQAATPQPMKGRKRGKTG